MFYFIFQHDHLNTGNYEGFYLRNNTPWAYIFISPEQHTLSIYFYISGTTHIEHIFLYLRNNTHWAYIFISPEQYTLSIYFYMILTQFIEDFWNVELNWNLMMLIFLWPNLFFRGWLLMIQSENIYCISSNMRPWYLLKFEIVSCGAY